MPLRHIEQTKSCIGGAVMSNPKVYDKIIAQSEPSIWVVHDRHSRYDNCWVDVAYPIKVTKEVTDHYQEYEKGFAFMECKNGYGGPKQLKELKNLKGFRDKFFGDAAAFAEQSHPEIFFVATFVSQHLKEQASPASAPRNMKTIVLAVTTKECPWTSNFLALDLTDEETNDSACESFEV